MVDFTNLLKKPAGQAMKPQTLPPGDYQGVIKSYELGDNNKNKTPYVRFQLGLIDWPANTSDEDKGQKDSDGNFHPTDLSKRNLRRDYYFTDDALFRLDDLIKSVGVQFNGRGYDEVLPELVGAQVLVEVKQEMNQQTSEIFNQVGKLAGAVQ